MAKAKFIRSEVVEAATELFWRKGYNCSSMQDVFRATGLQPGSLYNAFGNKEGLFEEAIRFYGARRSEVFKDYFATFPNKLEAVTHLLLDYVNKTQSNTYNGCFLVKSVLELKSMSNHRLLDVVNDQLDALESITVDALKAVYDKEIAVQKASALSLGKIGIVVRGFTKQSHSEIVDDLRSMFDWLPWEETLRANSERPGLAGQ